MDAFIGEVRLFPFALVPSGWAVCNGQLLSIAQNYSLFCLIDFVYGGDGATTFALPDLRGSVPVGAGVSVFGTERPLGQAGGSATVTLTAPQLPVHTHVLNAASAPGTDAEPAPDRALASGSPDFVYLPPGSPRTQLDPQSTAASGSGLPHNNLMPTMVMQYCIAVQGLFPPYS